MCELFAMSSLLPATVRFSLERLARRGGIEGPHRDGWGVAFYEGADVFLLREPRAAAKSNLVHFIEQHPPTGQLVISHIRLATHGKLELRNTQPFIRELGGYTHVFAHNGDLEEIEHKHSFQSERFQRVGRTDSEQAFCGLLERLAPLWEASGDAIPALTERLDVIVDFAAELRQLGPANFLYADADVIFAHAHYRKQDNDPQKLPGLYLLQRSCSVKGEELADAGVILSQQQEVTLLASVPLSDEAWHALAEGEVVVLKNGSVLARSIVE